MKKTILFLSTAVLSVFVMTSFANNNTEKCEKTCTEQTEQKCDKKGSCNKADSTACAKKAKAPKKGDCTEKADCAKKTECANKQECPSK